MAENFSSSFVYFHYLISINFLHVHKKTYGLTLFHRFVSFILTTKKGSHDDRTTVESLFKTYSVM